MSDNFDIASEINENFLEGAIKQHLEKQIKYSLKNCIDCDIEIPKERSKNINVIRCVECQNYLEKRNKHIKRE